MRYYLLLGLFTFNAYALTNYSVTFDFAPTKDHADDKIVITCDKRCDWDLNEAHGSASTDYFSGEMKALVDLVQADELPQNKVINREDFYVTVSLKANNRSNSFTLGQPRNYSGVDSERFSKLNGHIQKIEALVRAKRPHVKIQFDKKKS